MKRGSFVLLLICSLFLTIHAQSQRSGGLNLDDETYYQVPYAESFLENLTQTKLAPAVSLKKYAPVPQDQGAYNNCVGWATAYAARSIMEAKKYNCSDPRLIKRNAFSPGFIYKLIAPGNSCYTPVAIEHALQAMQSKGAAKISAVQEICPDRLSKGVYASASKYKIQQYERLFFYKEPASEKILGIKKSLAEGIPVVVGMRCTPSFEFADGYDLWKPKESKQTRNFFGHAVCIVAYDNAKYGGAFQVMNSWGTRWGNKGFIWIRYADFTNFVKYAYLMHPKKPNAYVSGTR